MIGWRAVAACLLLLAGCAGTAEPRWADDADVARSTYRANTAPEIRLLTVVSTRNGSGAHSALLITTPRERILFDPAGTFKMLEVPERNDVLHGLSPSVYAAYLNYHAREAYDVYEQKLQVTAEQSEWIAAIAKAYGAVPNAQCTLSVTRILREVPGFDGIQTTYFPNRARAQFAKFDGLETRVYSDRD